MPEECKSNTRKTVRAEIVFSDELPGECQPFEIPDGHMMMELELDDRTCIVIRPGTMDRALFDEWNRYLNRVTTQGNWSRDPSRGCPS